jgi:DNA modification methylase
MELNKVYNEDCLIGMSRIADKSVDMILCDLPYGTTACAWDTIIPLQALWKQYKRIISPKGSIVLTASQPFTTVLIASNLNWFCYSWIWEKESGSNFLSAKYMPLKNHEDVLVFSSSNDLGTNEELRQYFYEEKIKGGFTNKQVNEMLGYATTGSGMAGHYFKKDKEQFIIPNETDYKKLQETGFFGKPYDDIEELYSGGLNKKTYNPQMRAGKGYTAKQGRGSEVYGNKDNAVITINTGERYPLTVLEFQRDKDKIHPTQKPVALFEYLIKTYTNEGETVLDNCMGSGTTAIACINTNRNYIGFEKEEKYYNIIQDRIKKHTPQLKLIA